jgi:hypothetical protein
MVDEVELGWIFSEFFGSPLSNLIPPNAPDSLINLSLMLHTLDTDSIVE